MLSKDMLEEVILQQKAALLEKDSGLNRESQTKWNYVNNFAMIVSGIRRCGKSTLLHQILQHDYPNALYFNFDDPRLFDFEISDFAKLDNIITQSGEKTLMFDEIQVIKGWERYVRQKLDEGFRVFVTGSNASLLSVELGTTLTGRHITKELFPFSYTEFCRFFNLEQNKSSVETYIQKGGFPEYLKNNNDETLAHLLDDILFRDIAARYGIKDTKGLKRLTVYLLANIGNLTSANKLREPSGISSATTVLEYMSHLEQSYLLSFVPVYDTSLKKQSVNPKKIYAIDLGLINANVYKTKGDEGHKLENVVYNALRSKYKEIFYHKAKSECDFLILEKGTVLHPIQVCLQLNVDNQKREFDGLIEAMKTHNQSEGLIVTLSQKDFFEIDSCKINVIPSYEFLSNLFIKT